MLRNFIKVGQLARSALTAPPRTALYEFAQRSQPVHVPSFLASFNGFRQISSEHGPPHHTLGTKPSVEECEHMPKAYFDYSNEVLLLLSLQGDHAAAAERLTREIMHVDKVDWDAAQPRLKEMREYNKENRSLITLPYTVGIVSSVIAGFASFWLVFDLETALAFNTAYVTTDVADPEDLETILEVGAWTWNWMEPPLGQISFFLLCLQYSRAQLQNLGIKPYTGYVLKYRANRLVKRFPAYDQKIVEDFSCSDTLW